MRDEVMHDEMNERASHMSPVVVRLFFCSCRERNGEELFHGEDSGGETVVAVVRQVGDFISIVCCLRLKSMVQVMPGRVNVRMFQEAFLHLAIQVQPFVTRRMLLEEGDDAEGLFVVFKVCMEGMHPLVKRILAGVTERRVAEIVRECDAFRQVFVQGECPCDAAADLSDFHRVREARAVVIPSAGEKDLCLSLQSPECRGMQNSVPITLEREPRFIGIFGGLPPEPSFMGNRVGRKETVRLPKTFLKRKHSEEVYCIAPFLPRIDRVLFL